MKNKILIYTANLNIHSIQSTFATPERAQELLDKNCGWALTKVRAKEITIAKIKACNEKLGDEIESLQKKQAKNNEYIEEIRNMS